MHVKMLESIVRSREHYCSVLPFSLLLLFALLNTFAHPTSATDVKGLEAASAKLSEPSTVSRSSFSLSRRDEVVAKGKVKYEEILQKTATSGTGDSARGTRGNEEVGCWKSVLEDLTNLDPDACADMGEATRSILAIALTKCHFSNAKRRFPQEDDGCYYRVEALRDTQLRQLVGEAVNDGDALIAGRGATTGELSNPCLVARHIPLANGTTDIKASENHDIPSKNIQAQMKCEALRQRAVNGCTSAMSDTAFQMYYESLNHIDDICFYFQATLWNQRTEHNISRLTDFSSQFADQMERHVSSMGKMEEVQQRQLEGGNRFEKWLQDVHSDTQDLFSLLYSMRDFQKFVMDSIRSFSSIFMYAMFAVLAILFTAHEAASRARPRLFILMASSLVLELLVCKMATYYLAEYTPYNIDPEQLTCIVSWIRWAMFLMAGLVWFSSLLRYRAPIAELSRQIDQLKELVEGKICDGQSDKILQQQQQLLALVQQQREEAQKMKQPFDTPSLTIVERFFKWQKNFMMLDENSEDDPDYTPSSAALTMEDSDEEETYDDSDDDTLSVCEESLMTNNQEGTDSQNGPRRNPLRNVRPKTFEPIRDLGSGMIGMKAPAEFGRQTRERRCNDAIPDCQTNVKEGQSNKARGPTARQPPPRPAFQLPKADIVKAGDSKERTELCKRVPPPLVSCKPELTETKKRPTFVPADVTTKHVSTKDLPVSR